MSIAWPGLDAQETPPRDVTAWVLQADGLRYARVNTAIGELDTVRAVSNPSRIVTAPTGAYMFTDSDSKVIRIDDAVPIDLDTEGLRDASAAPAGTAETDSVGDYVAYRTDAGAVYAGRLSTGTLAQIDPRAGGAEEAEAEDAAPYTSDAISVTADGDVFSYSADDGTVVRVDIAFGAGGALRRGPGRRGRAGADSGRRRLGAARHRRGEVLDRGRRGRHRHGGRRRGQPRRRRRCRLPR
ncbi:hypothetical protein [Microbacterium aurum]